MQNPCIVFQLNMFLSNGMNGWSVRLCTSFSSISPLLGEDLFHYCRHDRKCFLEQEGRLVVSGGLASSGTAHATPRFHLSKFHPGSRAYPTNADSTGNEQKETGNTA